MNGVTYGVALELAKAGGKIARKGWNGAGIFVTMKTGVPGISDFLAIDTTGLQTANPDAPKAVTPWLASQTDQLSADWVLVP
jgi:hypothetical protein